MTVVQLSDHRSLGLKRAEARERERLATAERLNLSLSKSNRLGSEDRSALARNVGRLAEERAAAKDSIGNAKTILRRAFEEVADSHGSTEERWPKRLRWSRLEGEDKKEELSGRGLAYLELAKAIARVTGWNEARAVIKLAEGTSFSPDVMTTAGEKVGAVASQIASGITALADESIPKIRSYFATVERLSLTHPITKQPFDGQAAISHFDTSVFRLNPWDGEGAEGQLCAGELHDGDPLTEESWGSASLLPSVTIASITSSAHVPVIDFSNRPCTEPGDAMAFERLAAELQRPGSELATSGIVSQRFDIFLVLGPGETPSGSLRLGLIVEAQDMDWLIPDNFYQPVGFRPASSGPWRIFENQAWEADPRGSLLREKEAAIFWLHETGVRDLLALVGKPQNFAFLRSMANLGDSDLEITPHIQTAGFTDADPRSLEGILDTNVKYQSGDQNVIHKLFNDARRRMARLDEHLEKWRSEYTEATANFQELRREP